MTLAVETRTLRKSLLGGVSAMAFTLALGMGNAAYASSGHPTPALTYTPNGTTVTSTDTNGLLSYDASDHAITIDTSGGHIFLGDLGIRDAITLSDLSGGTYTATYNLVAGPANYAIIFDGDVRVEGDESIVLNGVSVNTFFNSNVIVGEGSATLILSNIGDSVSFDTPGSSDTNIDMAVLGNEANTGPMIVRNSGDDDNKITFVQAIGGGTDATSMQFLDIFSNTTVTFESTVRASLIYISSSNLTTFKGNVTGNVYLAGGGTISMAPGTVIDGDVGTVSDVDNSGKLIIGALKGGGSVVTGNVGATNSLAEVTIDTSGGMLTFDGSVNTVNFTASGGDFTVFSSSATITNLTADNDVYTNGTLDVNGSINITGGGLYVSGSATLGGASIVADQIALYSDVTFDGTEAQTVTGLVDANNNDNMTLTNTQGVTFESAIGGSGAIGTLSIGSNAVATFESTVRSGTIIIGVSGLATFNNSVTSNIELKDDGTVVLTDGGAVTGNVDNTSGADNSGKLTIGALAGGGSVVTGAVGATNSLAEVNIDTSGGMLTFDGSVNTVNFTASGGDITLFSSSATITNLTSDGDVYTRGALDANGSINMTGRLYISGGATLGGTSIAADQIALYSDVTFDGIEAQTVTGLVNANNNDNMTLTNTQGVIFESAIGEIIPIGALTIGSGFSGRFNKTLRAGSIDLGGTIQIEDTVTLTGNLDIGDGAKIILGGGIVATETAFTIADVVSAGTTTIEVSPTFTAGTITLFDSAADASGDLANLTITDTALTDYTLVVNGNDIEITAVAKTAEETEDELDISGQDSDAIRNARLAIATNNDKLLVNFAAALNAGGAAAAKAAETVAVQADTLGAGSNVAVSVGGKVAGISYNRLATLRSGGQHQSSAETGFATGDVSSSTAVWFKPFGNWAAQDNTNGVAGFDATTYGAAFGADTEVDDNIRLGGTLAYATTNVDGSGAGQATSEIDSYQMTVYGDYTTDNYFIEGSLGYAYNQNDVSRVINLSGTPTVANGEYNSSQFMASINTGVPLKIDGATYFTPTAGLSWTHVASTSYTETGAGGLNQSVDIDAVDVLIGSLGGKFHTQIQSGSGHFVPEIHGGINYDVIGDNTVATASFTGGGAAFTVEGADVEQFGGNIGFGLTYVSNYAWSLGMRYDADMKASYLSHSAIIEARVKF